MSYDFSPQHFDDFFVNEKDHNFSERFFHKKNFYFSNLLMNNEFKEAKKYLITESHFYSYVGPKVGTVGSTSGGPNILRNQS